MPFSAGPAYQDISAVKQCYRRHFFTSLLTTYAHPSHNGAIPTVLSLAAFFFRCSIIPLSFALLNRFQENKEAKCGGAVQGPVYFSLGFRVSACESPSADPFLVSHFCPDPFRGLCFLSLFFYRKRREGVVAGQGDFESHCHYNSKKNTPRHPSRFSEIGS